MGNFYPNILPEYAVLCFGSALVTEKMTMIIFKKKLDPRKN